MKQVEQIILGVVQILKKLKQVNNTIIHKTHFSKIIECQGVIIISYERKNYYYTYITYNILYMAKYMLQVFSFTLKLAQVRHKTSLY